MCVICIKPKGVEMPNETWIENMWYNNNDGAGFMWADGKRVHIKKGYMDLSDFLDALDDLGDKKKLKELPIVMHFRIGTAGGNIPANTHPFPITDSIPVLQKLACTTTIGVVHNGIIPINPRQTNISDTMEYIASTLAPLSRYDNEFYRSKDLLQMIGNQTTSKLAFMNAKGQIFTVGSFSEDEGCLFSNTTYLSSYWYRRVPTHFYGSSPYDYSSQYDEWGIGGTTGGEYVEDLMPLDNGDYVINFDTGIYYGCDEYMIFMDSVGFLYVYDDTAQACYPLDDNYQAYNSHGNTVRYCMEKASAMIILDEDPIKLTSGTIEDSNETEEKNNNSEKDMPF